MPFSDEAARRLVRVLVRVFPPPFRRAFQADLLETFSERYREHRLQGPTSEIRFWCRVVADMLQAGLAERVKPTRRPGETPLFLARPVMRLNTLLDSLRHARRALTQTPGFTIAAITILSLGLSGAVVVFAVVKTTLLHPLPYPREDRLVQLYEVERDGDSGRINDRAYFAWGNYADIRDHLRAFRDVAAWQYHDRTLTGDSEAVRLTGRNVTDNFFRMIGVAPIIGRDFRSEDTEVGAERVVVIAHHIWRSVLGADPAIVGQKISLDGVPHRVVGVTPAGFDFPFGAELWTPLRPFLGDNQVGLRRFHRYRVAARLDDGVSIDVARDQLASLAAELERRHPETNRDNSFAAVPLRESITGDAKPALRVAFAGSLVLLLAACANIGALFSARFSRRARDFAVRTALGATRGRLMLDVLVECTMLSAISGALAVLLAAWLLPLVAAIASPAMPRIEVLELDAGLLAFAATLMVATGLIAGLVPAWRTSRTDLNAVMAANSRSAGSGSGHRVSGALLVAQFALAIVVTNAATLLVRSFMDLMAVNTNVQIDRLIAIDVALPSAYADNNRAERFYQEFIGSLQTQPGVVSAAAVLVPPVIGSGWGNRLYRDDLRVPEADVPIVGYQVVTENYFQTAGIPIVRGRPFDERDRGRRVVIISKTTADRLWQGQNPVGATVRFAESQPEATIVGVAADVPPQLGEAPSLQAYVTPTIESVLGLTVLVNVSDDAVLQAQEVRSLLRRLDPNVPLVSMTPLSELVAGSVARPRLVSVAVSGFAIITLVVSLAGVGAMVAYRVSTRVRDYGIKLALGASPAGLVLRTMLQGVVLATIGGLIGALGSFATSGFLTTLLYEVSPTDPTIHTTVFLVVILVASAAALVPALRVTRVDPVAALRAN